MARISVRIFVVVIFSAFCGLHAQQAPAPEPLHDSELLALVGGNALPENIVAQLNAGGIDFRVTPEYRAQLKSAGAGDDVLTAAGKARIVAQGAQTASTAALLQHLSVASQLAKQKKFDDAIKELDAAIAGSDLGPETGFVLGSVLVAEGDFENAAAVYTKVLELDPAFPEAHTKLSYVCYRMGDGDEALHQAKLALQATPNNPEAHKFAGLALTQLEKSDAAKAEFKEALRLKPSYQSAHLDMGILYEQIHDASDAVFEYKQAIAGDPNDVSAHFGYGNVLFEQLKDLDGALREYRTAKKLDPSRFDIRQNLSDVLMQKDMRAAIVELREMEAMFPESAVCHECLGNALFSTGDIDGASKEFETALRLDPSDPMAYINVGNVAYSRKKFDDALVQYRKAEQIDPSNASAHMSLGVIYMEQKHDLNAAIDEFKQAEALMPSNAQLHDYFGVALSQAGRTSEAISELKEAVALDPGDLSSLVNLAQALEKNRDWPAALADYRKAAIAFSQINLTKGFRTIDDKTPQQQYEEAQKRFSDYIGQLNASGKAAEAAALQKQIAGAPANASLSQQMDDAMLAGATAVSQRNATEAKHDFETAVKLGGQVQPHDIRLVHALEEFGKQNIGIDSAAAQAAFERELQVINELYGTNSGDLEANALQLLGSNAFASKEYDSAIQFYMRALDLKKKVYGEHATQLGDELRLMSRVYEMQNQFEKAEPYLLEDVKNAELTGAEQYLPLALWNLAFFYDRWGAKPQQTFDYQSRVVALVEKQFGANSTGLVEPLKSEEKALRALGRNGEADQVAARLKTIQSAPVNSNPNPQRDK